MRTFTRIGATPPTLRAGKGRAAADANVEAHAESRKPSFPAHWNEPDVRGLLYASFGRVCAYCGCRLPRNDRGDVEHYRPKSAVAEDEDHGGYWWLAYTFDNYTLACSICNSSRKGTKFPLFPGKRRVVFETRGRLRVEGRALLDPCEDDAERALFVDVDAPLCDVRVATGIEEGLVARAKFTIDFFRLCVDPMLVKERKDALDEVLEWLNDGKVDKVRRAASRYSPHSHVAKAVLTRTNRPLPTPDEEIAWLTEDLVEEVDIALDLLHRSPSDVKLKAQVIELCHALGGLLHAPPRGSPNAVRTVLEQNELLDEIEPYADALRV